MEITSAQVKALREATGAGMMDCKRALQQADGDFETAKKILRETGKAGIEKRAGRAATEGVIEAYLHTPNPNLPPKRGVLVELDCETDFVAKTVQELLDAYSSKVRERLVVRRFCQFKVGESA